MSSKIKNCLVCGGEFEVGFHGRGRVCPKCATAWRLAYARVTKDVMKRVKSARGMVSIKLVIEEANRIRSGESQIGRRKRRIDESLTIDGVTRTVGEWLELNDVSLAAYVHQIRRGVSKEDAVRYGGMRHLTCPICGKKYNTISSRTLSCLECRMYVSRARSRLRLNLDADEITHEMVIDLAKKMATGKVETVQYSKTKNRVIAVCPACGKRSYIRAGMSYCKSCITNGYDALHEVTGKQYRHGVAVEKSIKTKELVPGWRGRPVLGGSGRRIMII